MEELYATSLMLHKFFIICLFFLTLIYLYLTQVGSGVKLVKRIRIFLPTYYSLMAAVAFTGIIILPILRFQLSHKVIMMIVVFFVILVLSIMGYKWLKKGWRSRNLAWYKKRMVIILSVNLVLILITWFI